jgi:hypothetical protein
MGLSWEQELSVLGRIWDRTVFAERLKLTRAQRLKQAVTLFMDGVGQCQQARSLPTGRQHFRIVILHHNANHAFFMYPSSGVGKIAKWGFFGGVMIPEAGDGYS